jgi:hypothetical protein
MGNLGLYYVRASKTAHIYWQSKKDDCMFEVCIYLAEQFDLHELTLVACMSVALYGNARRDVW